MPFYQIPPTVRPTLSRLSRVCLFPCLPRGRRARGFKAAGGGACAREPIEPKKRVETLCRPFAGKANKFASESSQLLFFLLAVQQFGWISFSHTNRTRKRTAWTMSPEDGFPMFIVPPRGVNVQSPDAILQLGDPVIDSGADMTRKKKKKNRKRERKLGGMGSALLCPGGPSSPDAPRFLRFASCPLSCMGLATRPQLTPFTRSNSLMSLQAGDWLKSCQFHVEINQDAA